MTIYTLTDLATAESYDYTAVKAFLLCQRNPIFYHEKSWSRKVKQNGGYPIEVDGWRVEKKHPASTAEVLARQSQII